MCVCVCARGCINSKAVSRVPQETTPLYKSSLCAVYIYMVCEPAMSRTKNPVRISPLTFFQFSMCARGFAGIDSQSVKALGQKPKVSIRRSNFASAGTRRGIKAKIPLPRLAEQIASYRVSERKKSLEIGNCRRFGALASNCFSRVFFVSISPSAPIEEHAFRLSPKKNSAISISQT